MSTLRPYPKYKAVDLPWLKEIPSHWELKKIRSHFSERKTKVSDKDFTPLSVAKQGVVPQLESACKTDDGNNRKLVKSGDFVINSRSDRKGSSGLSTLEGSVSLINIVLCPRNICRSFVEYLLKSNSFIEEFYRNGRGIVADLWTTRYQDMRNISIPVPPRDEQEKIVAFLDEKTAKIDKLIAAKTKEIELIKEQQNAEISQAVTRGLNPNVKFKAVDLPWLKEIPSHWELKKLKYLFKERSQKGFPNEPLLAATQSMGVVPKEVYGERTVEVTKDFDILKLVEIGDFVASLRSFQGGLEYAYYRGIISPAYTIITSNGEIRNEFFRYFAKSIPFIQLLRLCVKGIREGQNINYEVLKNRELPIPPRDEQEKIVAFLDEKTAKYQKAISTIQKKVDLLKEYKTRLISDAVTGKIKV